MNDIVKSIAGILPVAVLLTACASQEQPHPQSLPVKVTVQPIQASPVLQAYSYAGTIEPDNTAQIGFSVPGVINQVTVQEGQFVQKGALLASIDATEYSNALTIANATVEQAEDLYNRLNELYQKGSLPAKDYIDIKTKLAQAKANKAINEKHIADSRLYAPITGIITAKLIEKGSAAAPGVPAFTIVKTDWVYAKISVPESEIGQLRMGMDASVSVPTLQKSFTGKVAIINPQADPVSKAYSVKIRLNNSTQILLPGMLTNVQLQANKTEQAIVIPATAVVRDADDITYVYVVNAQHMAIRKRIDAGAMTGQEDILVKGGLQNGDRIVTAGQTNLKDGTLVVFD